MRAKRSFLRGLHKHFGRSYETVNPETADRLRLSGKGIRVQGEETSFAIEMGKQTLHVCPELPLNPRLRKPPYDYVVFDPELYYSGIAHSLRLRPGETLSIDHRQEQQKLVFGHPKHAFRRHLQISHEEGGFGFRDPISELGTYLSILPGEQGSQRFQQRRLQSLQRINELFGGPLVQLSPDCALRTLKAVNQHLRREPYRKQDSLGNAGSVVELPPHLTPVIVGDLHAQVDNLLKILSENSFLAAMGRGEAALILLGDAVHPGQTGNWRIWIAPY